MQYRIHAVKDSSHPIRVPDVPQLKLHIGIVSVLFSHKKQLTFIVVDSNNLGWVILQRLPQQFSAYGTTHTGNQDYFSTQMGIIHRGHYLP